MVFKLVQQNAGLLLAILGGLGGLVHLFPSFLTPIVSGINFFGITLQMVVGFLTIVFAVIVGYELS